ncbi:amino acid adenylation domain-containing protein [Enterovibrio sp. ZSDZ35]|uniref:Amino acid adenylation domain-containing protein n=1 Tax=Enterovibrio qingdaonensis TaxID=2899818 RepID=A0ABT5QHE2_9GAMM|nr:non-ribosomal peptide synthetase [Enterovibrio sp. ZSDZ35]MDD1780399.1 amino acid adenylation domain-containing protein [Enterovibrio sp. ZSDZ35]
MSGIDKSNVSAILPLLPLQEGLLFHHISEPDSPVYFEQLRLNVSGDIDIDRLQFAWNRVVENNDALRTVFRWQGIDKPVQIVLKERSLDIEQISRQQANDNTLSTLRSPSLLDLQSHPIRLSVIEKDANVFTLVLSFHHILLDGWSSALILKSLLGLYKNTALTLEKTASTKDIHEAWKKADTNKALNWWKTSTSNAEVNRPLPKRTLEVLDVKSRAVSDNKIVLPISSPIQARIEALTEKEGVTPAAIFHAVFSLCLRYYQNQKNLTFATTVSGRNLPVLNIADTAGLFINTLPFCAELEMTMPFSDWVKKVQLQLAGINEHSTVALKDVHTLTAIPQNARLFDSLLVVENYPLDTTIADGTGFSIQSVETTEETDFDLTLAITQMNGYECNLITQSGKFDPSFGHAFLAHFSTLLDNAVSEPSRQLKSLSPVERRTTDSTIARPEYNSDLVTQLKLAVDNFGERAALSNPEQSITYQELDKLSNKVAAGLASMGIRKGDVVGISLPRGTEMVLAIWGVLKAGAAYLPILPDLPKKRSAFMMEDTGAKLCIVSGQSPLASTHSVADVNDLLGTEGDAPSVCINSSDTAYIIYSSGSTGQPKGILTPHGAVAGFAASPTYVEISENDRVLQLSSYGFDGSVFDIFTTLCNGAELVLLDDALLSDLNALTDYISDQNISIFFVTTALFNALVDTNLSALEQVNRILFGGEKVSVPHVKKAFRKLGPNKLVHVYGPTETTVFAAAYPIQSTQLVHGTIPIGSAINDSTFHVLDVDQLPCLPGVPGELYIGGPALAKGYLNRPDLTQERFTNVPHTQDWSYRTGDEVVETKNGVLIFNSRLDSQVKIRGLRIELGEIASQLIDVTGASDVYVAVQGNDSGNGYIIAYLCQNEMPNKEKITAELAEFLPRYMLPQHYIRLDRLPLTANNKVDLNALPTPETERSGEPVQPKTETEVNLLAIWQKVLVQPTLSVTDDVFNFGANSIAFSRVSAQMQKHFGKQLDIKTLFSSTTVREQSHLLDTQRKENTLGNIERNASLNAIPATSIQAGLYTQAQMQPGSTAYNMPIAFSLLGETTTEQISVAFERVCQRHPVLFSRFHYDADQLHQTAKVTPLSARQYAAEMPFEDCWKDFVQPFDLTDGKLVRLGLQALENKHRIFIDIHHIVADGVSILVLINQFLDQLEGNTNAVVEPEVRFGDYAVWQASDTNQSRIKHQKDFWQNTLVDIPPRLDLITDFPHPDKRTFKGEQFTFDFDAAVSEEIRTTSNAKVSVNTLFFTAFHLVLAKYSQQADFCSSILSTGRTHHQTQEMVGMFNNFLPIPFSCEANQSVQELLEGQQERLLEALQNQDFPYHDMVSHWSQPEPGRNPYFDTMFVFHNQLSTAEALKTNAFLLEKLDTPSHFAKLDLKLDIYPSSAHGYTATIEFSTELFKRETITSLAQQFQFVIRQIISDANTLVRDIMLVEENEKQQLLETFNDTYVDRQLSLPLIERFEQRVLEQPGAIAISSKDGVLTWSAFNRKVNRLAHYLREEGVGPESIVAVQVPRSLDMMVALFAITKAGGAWLPIHLDNPEQRTQYILDDSDAILHLHWASPLSASPCRSIDLHTLDTSGFSETNPERLHSPANLAYVIYTSGSTGEPKGVLIEHDALVNRLDWMQSRYPISNFDTVLQKTPYTFDVSVWELVWWSFTGARLFLLGQDEEKDPQLISKAIDEQGITCMHFVPSMLSEFLSTRSEPSAKTLHSLKQVFTSGEALTYTQASDFQKRVHEPTGATLHNLYGPTEATIDVSYFDCVSTELPNAIPIGKPIDNTTLLVLDQHLQLCPIGVAGELYIGGDNLARGYLNKPRLTAERFISNPFGDGRLYKTGDKARWKACGNIEYLGRLDHQVKIRGQRIETGEIESVLSQITNACHVGTYSDGNNELQLAAWYVPVPSRSLSNQELRNYLLTQLPSYMVPSAFVPLDNMPLTGNGKLDRKALPVPQLSSTFVAPVNQTEATLANIVEHILKREKVGREDDFFLIGGHSLSATRLMAKIREEWDIAIPLSDIFAYPVVKALATQIEQASPTDVAVIAKQPIEEKKVLSFGQQRMWLVDKIDHTKGRYNIHTRLQLNGVLDVMALEKAIQRTLARHDVLRTVYTANDGIVAPVIHNNLGFELTITNHSTLNNEAHQAALNALSEVESTYAFDLATETPLRAQLVNVADDNHTLLLTMHHIASDGWSLGVLTKEIGAHYRDITSGHSTSLEPLEIQYSDYANWQREFENSDAFARQKDHWLTSLDGLPECHALTLDSARPAVQTYRGDRYTTSLPSSLTDAVYSYAKESGSTAFMVLQTVFSLLISKYSNESDIVMGTPIANREQTGVEELIGFFVNTLVLRSDIDASRTFSEQLKKNKQVLLNAYANQQYPFEQLVDELSPSRSLSHHPLFQIMMVMQNQDISFPTIDNLTITADDVPSSVAKFDLLLDVAETDNSLRFHWDYAADLFTQDTIKQMATHFEQLLFSVLEQPNARQSTFSLLTQEEQTRSSDALRKACSLEVGSQDAIVQRFEDTVRRFPKHIAVSFDNQTISYEALDASASQLAHLLVEQGVSIDKKVALIAEPGFDMIISILAILKSGAAYVPVDPHSPEQRIQHILSDCDASLVLKATELDTPTTSVPTLALRAEDTHARLQNLPTHFQSCVAKDQIAYVIYTSGSTGLPKGVQVTHENVIRLFDSTSTEFDFNEHDVWTLFHSFAFDFSVWEIWGALLNGGKLVIVPSMVTRSPSDFRQILSSENVTVLNQTPSAFNQLIEADKKVEQPLSLRFVIFGGEALTLGALKPWIEKYPLKDTALINMYGITETTVHVTYKSLTENDINHAKQSLIGSPISDLYIYILGEGQALQPTGVPGEMYVGGAGISRGYLNRPELNQSRFIQDPYSPDKILYRTGDRARQLASGELEYLGRCDQQVKIRGFRIELGEIEHQLLAIDGVSEAVVVAEENSISAFVVSSEPRTRSEYKNALEQHLPTYMLPASFTELESIPLTINGKADKNKLLAMKSSVTSGINVIHAETETERKLVEIWQSLLDAKDVSVTENFFDLGANSLLIVQAHSRIDSDFPDIVRVTDLFSHTSIRALGDFIDGQNNKVTLPATTLPHSMFHRSAGRSITTLKANYPKDAVAVFSNAISNSPASLLAGQASIFAYLLAQLNKQHNVNFTYALNSTQLVPFSVDLANSNSIGDMVEETNKKLVELAATQVVFDTALPEPSQAHILLKGEHADVSSDVLQEFDLVLTLPEDSDNTSLSLSFDAGRLQKEQLNNVLSTYLKLFVYSTKQLAGAGNVK